MVTSDKPRIRLYVHYNVIIIPFECKAEDYLPQSGDDDATRARNLFLEARNKREVGGNEKKKVQYTYLAIIICRLSREKFTISYFFEHIPNVRI